MRKSLIKKIANSVLKVNQDHPIRIGIDGLSASGKTYFADELALELKSMGCSIIRSGVDNFHNSSKIRYQAGKLCPIGYYRDSFDYIAITNMLLKPLGIDGNLQYNSSIFNFKEESFTQIEEKSANSNSILIFEGVMLFREELKDFWDLKIYIDIDSKDVIKRAINRDSKYFKTDKVLLEKYNKRYIPGQEYYINLVKPKNIADFVICNRNFLEPKLLNN